MFFHSFILQLARRFWGPYQAWRVCEDSCKGLDEYAPGDVVLVYFLELIKDRPALVPLIRVDARVGRRQSSSAAGSAKRASGPPSWAPPPSDGTPNADGNSGGAGALPVEPHGGGDPMASDVAATGGPLFATGWPSDVPSVEESAADAAANATPGAAPAPHQPPTPPPSSVGALSLPLVSAGPAGPAPGYPAADTDAAAVAAATAAATATLRASTGGGSAGLGKRPAAAGGVSGDYEEPPPKRHDSGGADHTAADLAAIASAYRSAKEAQAPLSIVLMLEEKLREAACNVTTSR